MEIRHQDVAEGLRELATWIESNQHIPLPYTLTGGTLNIFNDCKATLADIARAFGSCEKSVDDPFYIIRRKFGPITVDAVASRNAVCTKVVTGVEEYEEEEYAPDAPKITVKKTREIVEWQCPESLLEAKEKVSA